ncbi:MAG TPA: PadR family transcriptional regulator [Bryobacteraceae bacterium]|nr:PadR family transcriptional regulator [Bryobacteraceae bacterium]
MTEFHRIELPQGTLDLLVLQILDSEPQHGWGISERLNQRSNGALQVQQGSLYPALHRMERKGLVKGKWRLSENGRRAKYYELTAQGRKHLRAETESWSRLTNTVALILEPGAGQ